MANDNIMLRTSPCTIGVSRNPLRTLILETGAVRQANCSVTVVSPFPDPRKPQLILYLPSLPIQRTGHY
jgi:hypothetical protein